MVEAHEAAKAGHDDYHTSTEATIDAALSSHADQSAAETRGVSEPTSAPHDIDNEIVGELDKSAPSFAEEAIGQQSNGIDEGHMKDITGENLEEIPDEL